MTPAPPRVAFFTDCFHEVNGVALTSRQLHDFARRRELPFFSLHAGPKNSLETTGSVTTMEFQRGVASIPLDAGMHFDMLGMRYVAKVRKALEAFQPDVIHITGPGDSGLLGFALALRMHVPIVASWHTNLHEFGARRQERILARVLPSGFNLAFGRTSEAAMLRALQWFYGFGRVLLAPNPELIEMLEKTTRKPTFLMQRGVDTHLFDPARRDRTDEVFTIGFVGRLSPEKNVEYLREIEQGLIARGHTDFRFLIVGQGSQREWLSQNLEHAEFTGVLRGEPLARAYANMDVFAFPSDTDTFGNVVLEALASGVPAVVTGGGGPKFLVQEGITGFVAYDVEAFVTSVETLLLDRARQRAMSHAARQHMLGISWDAVFEKVYSAYSLAMRPVNAGVPRGASIITTDASRTRR